MYLNILLLTISLVSLPLFAGGESGGGGDAYELRVNEIRSDIMNWINDGGAQSLRLPENLSYDEYTYRMLAVLQPKNVTIGFTDEAVEVNGVPKTCRSYVKGKAYMVCNIARFKEMDESEQYRLIHHEYAGLAMVEMNEGGASDYSISSQITDFLRRQTVLKLAVLNNFEKSNSAFDPIEKLEEGRVLYAKTREFLKEYLLRIDKIKSNSQDVRENLLASEEHPSLKKVIAVCEKDLEKSINKYVLSGLRNTYKIWEDQYEENYKMLIENVNHYIAAEDCNQCDPDIRQATMTKYEEKIRSNIFKLIIYPSQYVDISFWMNLILDNEMCDFSDFFVVEGRESTKKVFNKEFSSFSMKLTPRELIESKYTKALSMLTENKHTTVRLKLSVISEARSYFSGKKVLIQAKYPHPIIYEYSIRMFPKLGNPIKIIQRDLK